MILRKAKIGEGLSWMSMYELFIEGVVFFGFVGSDVKVEACGFFESVEAEVFNDVAFRFESDREIVLVSADLYRKFADKRRDLNVADRA